MLIKFTIGLACLAATTSAATTSHETLTFDYGWRFNLGTTSPTPEPTPAPPTPVPDCANPATQFPVNASAIEYLGLQQISAAKSASACAAACCKQGDACFMWQFHQTRGCWAGQGKKGSPEPGWTGASRKGKAVPTPPPSPAGPILPESDPAAAPSFDDSKWARVQVPSDWRVAANYTSLTAH